MALTKTQNWQRVAEDVLQGRPIHRDMGQQVLQCPDNDLLGLLDATFRVRRQYFGTEVQLYFLKNAKSGLCPEDCGYCSQGKDSTADIPKYRWLTEEQLLQGAKDAATAQARTYCIVASGRGPSDREVEHVTRAVRKIKETYGLHICACLGLLTPDQARQLKAAGVDRINHNLNTSERYYPEICSTHTYEDRMETLNAAREAGLELCSGLIVGMGETQEDVLDVALRLQDLQVESIPVNFLNSIEGTQLEKVHELDPRFCLKALCLLRLTNPQTEIRIAGGREVNLRSLQPLGLYAANSMFVSDYLTTPGQPPAEDYQMIEDLGFQVVVHGAEAHANTESHSAVTLR